MIKNILILVLVITNAFTVIVHHIINKKWEITAGKALMLIEEQQRIMSGDESFLYEPNQNNKKGGK